MTDFSGETRHPKAAKDHRCIWCGETIPKGSHHAHYVGKWEGEFQDWRMHSECHEDASEGFEIEEGFTPFDHQRPTIDRTNFQ